MPPADVTDAPLTVRGSTVGAIEADIDEGEEVPNPSPPLEPAEGGIVAPNTVGAVENKPPRDPGVGAKVMEGAGVGARVLFPMMQGASTPSPQSAPDDRIVLEQQSVSPLVPSIEPHPAPPHCPHASAQQTSPPLSS